MAEKSKKPFKDKITPYLKRRVDIYFRKGLTDREISKKLKVSVNTFKRYKHVFTDFAEQIDRQKRRGKKPVKLTRGRPKGSDRLRQVRAYAVELSKLGESVSNIPKFLGVPRSTFNTWRKSDPSFEHELTVAKECADHDVIRALYKRATGFRVKNANQNETKFIDDKGKVQSKIKSKSSKYYAPDIKAIQNFLINRKDWSLTENKISDDTDSEKVEYDVRESLYKED